jgi:trehalose utilization protein
MSNTRVLVWNEFVHERQNAEVAKIYPRGIHGAIADFLRQHPGLEVACATLDQPEHGLTEPVLRQTDVLLWWGHAAHDLVRDEVVVRVHERVLEGMGFMALHSGHNSKIFKRLMGTSCQLCWREAGERERVWVVNPGHPIAEGIGEFIELEHSEMYGEPFGIPQPDEQVFVSWFEGGEVFRGGNCWTRGSGRVFYFSPGHETYPIYHHPVIQRVITNAVYWARPQGQKANVPRHVPVEQAREKIVAKGPQLHDASGQLGKGA